MEKKDKNNYISIAKAIGIILMVIGHSGCPEMVGRFLYTFHMPLFFLCSGYFFKDITSTETLKQFCIKRGKGLYLPYLRWSLLFLLLHNIFYHLHIYGPLSNSSLYTLSDFATNLAKAILMTDYELLIRPFWFMKELFLASLAIAAISFLLRRYCPKVTYEAVLVFLLLCTFVCKYGNVQVPAIGNVSVLTFSAAYFCSGIIYRRIEQQYISYHAISLALAFLVVILGSSMLLGGVNVDMRYTTTDNYILYYILSIIGIFMTLNVSKRLSSTKAKTILYYIGNHTMPILAMNLLALKVGSLIKIGIWHLPIDSLASYTVIYEHNDYFWIVYTICGIVVPLGIYMVYHQILSKIQKIIQR